MVTFLFLLVVSLTFDCWWSLGKLFNLEEGGGDTTGLLSEDDERSKPRPWLLRIQNGKIHNVRAFACRDIEMTDSREENKNRKFEKSLSPFQFIDNSSFVGRFVCPQVNAYMRYLWSDEQKHVLLNNDDSTPITSPCYFNQSIYAIQGYQLVRFNCEDGSREVLQTPTEFVQVSASYGRMFAVSRIGELFDFDANANKFLKLNVLSSNKCKHGTQLQYHLKVNHVVSTELSTVFIDDESRQLWSFPNTDIGSGNINATKIELSSCQYSIRQFAAGKRHCVVLVDFKNTNQKESSTDQSINVCEKCREDTYLRLSILMENADEVFQDNSSLETELADLSEIETPSTSQANNKSSRPRIGLNQIFSSIKSPFVKTSIPTQRTKSEWYAIPTRTTENDIELSTLANERPNPATSVGLSGSIVFRFVSLDNLLSSSDNSSPKENDEDRILFDETTNNNQLHSFVSEQVANTFCEVWCFGTNDLGQLGIGNNIPTRTPKRVKIPRGPVIKLAAGDNFTMALLASGEMFGWGANENNQLKLEASNYLPDPTPIKLGAKLCAIDVSTFSNVTYVTALSTENLNVVVCRFSKTHSEGSGITRLDQLEKGCLPLHIDVFENNKLFVGHLPLLQENTSQIKDSLKIVSQFLLSARTSLQLAHLAQSIKEKAERPSLTAFSLSLWKWTSIVSQLAEHLRGSLFINGNLEVKSISTAKLSFKFFMQTLFGLHYSYLDAIADSAFNDLNLGNEMQKCLEQLSLEHNAESSKESKKIQALFSIPTKEFFKLSSSINQVLATDKPSTFWRRLESEFQLGETWAKLTARNQDLRPPNLPISTLLSGFFEEPGFQIKNKSTSTPTVIRQFLSKKNNLLLVWTDSINVIQNDSIIRLEFPLLRIERKTDNPLLFCASDPEIKIEIEFNDATIANRFYELLNQAWEFSRIRRLFSCTVSSPSGSSFFETRLRYAKYTFSPFHTFSNATYEGAWSGSQPHGKGKLTYPDGRQYSGKFAYGLFHGYGELLVRTTDLSSSTNTSNTPSSLMNSIFYTQPKNLLDLSYSLKGSFKNGQLNGLGIAAFLNGDSYQGYFHKDQMHGHGVYKTNGSTYVGGFRNNLRNGYGVLSSNKDRYLGEWLDGRRHGLGTIITIDGVYHEGVFEQDKFVNGRAVFETPNYFNLAASVSYEGVFSGLNQASGKGTLCLNKYDKIVGTFSGNILNLSISNATYSHTTETDTLESDFIMTNGPIRSKWTLHEDKKWTELFVHFSEDVFGINETELQEILQTEDQIPADLSKRAWENLAYTITKTKQQKNVTFDDRLERIPNNDESPFSASYYASVSEYWFQAIQNEFHPLHRLLNGVGELFNSSYLSVGARSNMVMYDDSAVLEFRSLLLRCYAIIRLLFVKLPPSSQMFSLIQSNADLHHGTESSDSSSTAETMSIGSLEEAISGPSPSTENEPRIHVLQPEENARSTLLATPSCDFLVDYLFSECYSTLFTLYSEKCQTSDNRYWTRIMYLSSYTDAHLLRYFDVKNELWPINFENTRELDTFTVRVSAKNKFYSSAVTKLQELSCTINPTNKLAILADTFFEIVACTSKFSVVGHSHTWSIDELLPAFIYVMVRAQVQHLGAEIQLIHDFAPHVSTESSSEIALMFTVLQSAYYSICVEKGSP